MSTTLPDRPDPGSVAWSTDGTTFRFRAPIEAPFPVGSFVAIGPDRAGTLLLGQVLERGAGNSHADIPRAIEGTGALLPTRSAQEVATAGVGFGERAIRAAGPDEVRAEGVLDQGRGTLEVGSFRIGGREEAATLRAQGFTRHTFLCGQSGSGKTYAAGTILERLVAETSLRMVVLDPNGDYRRLTDPRPGGPHGRAERLRAADAKVTVHGSESEPPLIRLTDLSTAAQLALLRIDPVEDREEVGRFMDLIEHRAAGADPREQLRRLLDPANTEPLAVRARALGIGTWRSWALDRRSVVDSLDARDDVHLIDVSRVDVPQEMYAVAAAVLDHLWSRREDRVPTLIVCDEAHNLCASSPDDPLQRFVTDRLVQIAGEGRKFGLHLLMATQRPTKLHPNVMTQCDNLVLLRMNSPGDLAEIIRLFGFAPPGLVARSTSFSQGEAVVAGPISPIPRLMRFGGRVSHEGGADVPMDWLVPRMGR